MNSVGSALAVLYGGGVAVCNAVLLLWRWHQGAGDFHCDAEKHLRSFYRSALERFFIVGVLLAAGFGFLGMNGQGLLAGFLIGQFAWIVANPTMQERT